MKNKYIKLSAILFTLICIILTAGCASRKENVVNEVDEKKTMEKEESKAVSFSYIGGTDVMPITGYYGPHITTYNKDGYSFPDYVSDEYFKMISESGINVIVYNSIDYALNPDIVEKYLDLGEKYGLGIFVTDSKVYGSAGSSTPSAAQLGEEIANYYNHPAFCGVYLVDEPEAPYYVLLTGEKMISMYGELAHTLQEELGVFCYSNMLPCDNYVRDKENYEKYVNEFCETFRPKVLMWDYYVFDTYGDVQTYFWNMNLMREKSKEYGIPFWSFIQAGGRWRTDDPYFNSETYHPLEPEFNWNVNTSLAFGAQGIQYFPLVQPMGFAFNKSEDEGDFLSSGLIGAAGNRTQWYNYAQNINKQIAAIDEVLMNSVHKGIIVNGEQAKKDVELTSCVIEAGKFQELQSVTGDTMVGCFNYRGKTALYVVNYSMEYAQNIKLQFNDKYNIEVIQNAESSYLNGKSLTLDMAAGEGVLLVIE